jgi:HSP20 family protein
MTDDKRQTLNRMFEPHEAVRRLFSELVHQPWGGHEALPASTWQPCCDMVETDDAIIVEVELPGMQREDVHVDIQGDILRIAGERHVSTQRQGHNFHYLERQFGHFERQLPLPHSVDRDAIRADFSNGILVVTLPKRNNKQGETSREGDPHGQR